MSSGAAPTNFHEAGESHHLPIHSENRYLPPHRSEDETSTNVNGEHSNIVRTMTPQRLFTDTKPVTQPGANNEPLPFAGSMGALAKHP